MSLVFTRRKIVRAVSGELTPAQDARLRDHVRGCLSCRRFYDELSLLAAAAPPGGSTVAAMRERARLQASLGARGVTLDLPVPQHGRRRRRWMPLLLVPAMAAAIFAVSQLKERQEESSGQVPDIAWRGGGDTLQPSGATDFALLLYVRRKNPGNDAAPVRLLAELPGSGEATILASDSLQLAYRGLEKNAYVLVLGVDETGQVHKYFPETGGSGQVSPSKKVRVLGPPMDVASKHRPGRVHIYAAITSEPVLFERVRAAISDAGAGTSPLPGRLVRGMLNVAP